MTMDRRVDPVTPRLTFDNYVIPESVERQAPFAPVYPAPHRNTGMVIAVSVIAVLTFCLGILTTLQFLSPRAPAVAASVSAPAPALAAPEQSEPLDLASLEQDVTRQESSDLLTPTLQPALAEPQLTQLEVAVLQGLTPKRTIGKLTESEAAQRAQVAEDIVSRNKMRMLREGVLAGVYTVTAQEVEGNKRLILKTVNADLTQASMTKLLAKAAEEGRIDIPVSLITAGGGVDMDTMLFNLVQTSLAEDGTLEGREAAKEMSRRAFAASSAKTREIKGERIYIVEPGDSLAYLSLQFYGRPNDYGRIFRANRNILKSPDQIQIGQRLIIPG